MSSGGKVNSFTFLTGFYWGFCSFLALNSRVSSSHWKPFILSSGELQTKWFPSNDYDEDSTKKKKKRKGKKKKKLETIGTKPLLSFKNSSVPLWDVSTKGYGGLRETKSTLAAQFFQHFIPKKWQEHEEFRLMWKFQCMI